MKSEQLIKSLVNNFEKKKYIDKAGKIKILKWVLDEEVWTYSLTHQKKSFIFCPKRIFKFEKGALKEASLGGLLTNSDVVYIYKLKKICKRLYKVIYKDEIYFIE